MRPIKWFAARATVSAIEAFTFLRYLARGRERKGPPASWYSLSARPGDERDARRPMLTLVAP